MSGGKLLVKEGAFAAGLESDEYDRFYGHWLREKVGGYFGRYRLTYRMSIYTGFPSYE